MQLVYLNADSGVPLLGPKGASVHVREMLTALDPRVEGLTAVTARLRPRRARDRVAVPHDVAPPCPTVELLEEGASSFPSLLASNDAADLALRVLHDQGRLDALYERYSLWSVAGAQAAYRWGIPWILEVNAPLVDEAARHRDLSLRSVATFLERRLLSEASSVVTVSDELRLHVVARGAAPERVTVLPNGYNAGMFRDVAKDSSERPFTVAFVGSLKPWHGLDILADAFRRIHATGECRLIIVGDGPYRDELAARLRGELSESSFNLVGAVPHEQIPTLLRNADVAVAPYPALDCFYFSPLKIIEYCAMGLPVVASRVGQIAEMLTDDESALLVEPGSPKALAEALARLRSDPALRQRLGRAARRVAAGRSWGDLANRVVSLIETERAFTAPRASQEVGA
jgi:glycosyltransferase involved in cell wall biosynthesis